MRGREVLEANAQEWHATVESFRARVSYSVGREVEVWKVTVSKPYARGELARVIDEGIVVIGHGVIPYAEIDRVSHGGVSVPMVKP